MAIFLGHLKGEGARHIFISVLEFGEIFFLAFVFGLVKCFFRKNMLDEIFFSKDQSD